MKIVQDMLWAGTQASLDALLKAEVAIASKMLAGDYTDSPEEEDVPYLLEKQGKIGVISIKGSLTNRDSYWNRYYGITSYNDIREAVIAAAMDSDITAIVLDIDSGGGAVNGVSDTANLIRMVSNSIKQVTAFTDGTMASAAYWLGCSAAKVYSGNTALVGSIGIISTVMEYSKQLKDEGIGVTVARAGKYKALINSYEPPTKEALTGLQTLLDTTYDVFTSHVATMRNKSMQVVDDTMAQGREFIGQAAADVDLIDGITSFDKLLSKVEADSIDTSVNFIDNFKNSHQGAPMKKALTEQQIAALAAGNAVAADAKATAQAAQAANANPAADAGTESGNSEQDQAAAAAATAEAAAPAPVAAAAAPAAAATTSNEAVIAFLQGELQSRDASLLAANVELAQLKKQHDESSAVFAGLIEIAGKSANNMRVALSCGAMDFSAVTPLQLLAEHKRISEQFNTQFKSGGVAAVDAAETKPVEAAKVDPLHFQRLAAVRSTAKAK